MITKPKHYLSEGGIYCATHVNYLLTCADYRNLWSRAQGRCEICGTPSYQGNRGWLKLRIDHDGRIGQYAVRGVLCNDCNTRLGWHAPEDDARGRYLRNPWWVSYFNSIGSPLAIAEPEPGRVARIGRSQLCRWGRDDLGWYCLSDTCRTHWYYHQHKPGRRTWRELHHTFGPRNIQIQPGA